MSQSMDIGTVDYSVDIFLPDPASAVGKGKTGLVAADMTVSLIRCSTSNVVTVLDRTSSLNDLATLATAHTDWGWKQISATLASGHYRLDVADEFAVTGFWWSVLAVCITSGLAAASPKEFILTIPAGTTGGPAVIGAGLNNFKSDASANVSLTTAYDYAKGTVAMAESYAANGVAPTPVQAMMAMHQMMMQFGIASTNYTVKKLDNTTTAFVVTLDSATVPTSAARV